MKISLFTKKEYRYIRNNGSVLACACMELKFLCIYSETSLKFERKSGQFKGALHRKPRCVTAN